VKKAARWRPFYVWRLPPAKLRAGKRRDGNDQHNEGRFSHLCPRRRVTADKNHAKNITAVIKITTGKRIPILISSPVSVL
jgi:hypothetical protein